MFFLVRSLQNKRNLGKGFLERFHLFQEITISLKTEKSNTPRGDSILKSQHFLNIPCFFASHIVTGEKLNFVSMWIYFFILIARFLYKLLINLSRPLR